eukprot:g8744.t1
MNGIPAFLMSQQDSNSDGKHQYLHLGAGTSNNQTDIIDSSTGQVPIEVGTSSSNVERLVDEKTESALNSAFLPEIICYSFSVDSSRFAICYTNGKVTIWDSDHGVLMKKAMIACTQANAVSFLGNSNNIVLICTQDYKCWKWDISGGDDSKPTECLDPRVLSQIQEEQVFWQRADFFLDGTVLVFSNLANCPGGRKMSIVLVYITSEYPMFEQYPSLLFSIKEDFVISQVSMSPNGTGLLVSLMDEQMEDGYCMLWPEFTTNPCLYRNLDIGAVGSWSIDGNYVVTWTMTRMSNLEDINGSSAFVWSVNEIAENPRNLEYTFKHKITNPFKEKVFWCQMIEDIKEKYRLIMGIVGETARFLFWDMESMARTHTIDTSIITKDIILFSDEDWTESLIERKTVKDLFRMHLTRDGRYFGAVLGRPSALLMWDAILGVKVLEVPLRNVHIGHSNRHITLKSSPCRKFAIIGSEEAMVFCLSIHNGRKNGDKQSLEAQMVQLKNQCIKPIKDLRYKMKFSGDGDTLGVLCTGLSKIQIWNLPTYTTCIFETADIERGNINDFCLSSNGEHLAACTDDNILVWMYKAGTMQPLSKIRIDFAVVDMGINDDGSKLVLCLQDGSILIYHSTGRAEISNVNDENGTSAYRPLRQDNTRQQHVGPSSSVEEPLLSYESVTNQTQSEDAGNNAPILMEYPYDRRILARECEEAKFQVSPNFERVIRISCSHAEEWNLETGEKTENAVVDIENIIKSSESYSRVSSINKRVSKKLQLRRNTHLDGTNITLTKQTTVVQSSEKHIIVVANASSSKLKHRTESENYDVVYDEETQEDFHSVYIVNLDDEKRRRRLSGRNLDPNQGLAISEDGRHVACFAGDFGSKIIVWNAYASESLLPDYHFLALNNAIENKKAIKKEFVPMMDFFGVNLFQFRHPNGMSVLDEAIRHFNYDLLKTILQYASNKKVKISFLVPIMKGAYETPASYCNMVDVTMAGKSPKTLKIVLKYLFKRVTHETEIATILELSLEQILQEHPQVFKRVLCDPRILGSCYEIEVLESVFQRQKLLTCTTQFLPTSCHEAIELWRNELDVENTSSSLAKIKAIAMTVPCPNATQLACGGLLHGLLVQDVDQNVFNSLIVEALVDYKLYAEKFMIVEVVHYVWLLIAYMLYCFMICIDGTYKTKAQEGNMYNSNATKISLVICSVLALPFLFRELHQSLLHTQHHKLNGYLFWLSSTWTKIKFISYITIAEVIPLLDVLFLQKRKKLVIHSVIVGAECVLLCCHVLYYARVSRRAGRYITVITEVVSAVLPFLFIAFCVMFGFAVAFHVLYQHVDDSVLESDCEECENEDALSLRKSFGTFGRTLFAVFGCAFGHFDLDNIYHAPNVPAATILFVLYMVVMATTFLNMLIAIMGHEFEKIHRADQSRFLKAKAMIIDDIEMMMSERNRCQIKCKNKRYLQVLVPLHVYEKAIKACSPNSKETENAMRDAMNTEFHRRFDDLKRWLVRSYPPHADSSRLNRTMTRRRSHLLSIPESREQHQASVDDNPDLQDDWYDSDSTVSEDSVIDSNEDFDR